MSGFDYSNSGSYFITICVKDRLEYFGEIFNKKMILNKNGKIAQKQWLWLTHNFPGIYLDNFVIMPNHIHGIIEIDYDFLDCSDNRSFTNQCRDNPRVVPTRTGFLTQTVVHTSVHARRYNLLSKAINAFKTTSSKLIHLKGVPKFEWQRSFYDHIVRDDRDLMRIRSYIENNPANWGTDRNNH